MWKYFLVLIVFNAYAVIIIKAQSDPAKKHPEQQQKQHARDYQIQTVREIIKHLERVRLNSPQYNLKIQRQIYRIFLDFEPKLKHSILFSLVVKRTLQAIGKIHLAARVMEYIKTHRPVDWDSKEEKRNANVDVIFPDASDIIRTLQHLDDGEAMEGDVEKAISRFLVDMEVFRQAAPKDQYAQMLDFEMRRLQMNQEYLIPRENI